MIRHCNFALSGLGLHCLSMSHKKDARLNKVKIYRKCTSCHVHLFRTSGARYELMSTLLFYTKSEALNHYIGSK